MKTYSIKEVSEMFQLPSSTLRYYEEMGILTDIERTASGKRIYTETHINRLGTISCFKKTGMSISQLKAFFSYEANEAEHIDDILALLTEQKESVAEQIEQLQNAYTHVLKKLDYYGNIKTSLETNQPLPKWED